MKILLTLVFFLFFTGSALAFECSDDPLENLYKDAERAFLIYVTGTRLDETLFKELKEAYAAEKGEPVEDDDEEHVKAIFADYEVLEDYKGDPSFKPKLVDFLGIGMGYVGLSPGKYYVVILPPVKDAAMTNIRAVNICDVPYEHYRLKVDGFQKQLDSIRALRDKAG